MSDAAPTPVPGDRCPRCGGAFHCGVDDAAPCPCTRVRLDAATQAALRERYTGCLCLRCLVDLSRSPERVPMLIARPTGTA